MKRVAVACVGLLALAGGSAVAAELAPYYQPGPAYNPIYTWTGFYVGINGGGEVEVLFRLGQRLLLVLLEEFARGIDVVLAAVHAAKVRRRRGRGHPARTNACAQRGVRAAPVHIRLAPFGLRARPASDRGSQPTPKCFNRSFTIF